MMMKYNNIKPSTYDRATIAGINFGEIYADFD